MTSKEKTSPGSPPLRIGVALGGGSARGYAHIGALETLERHAYAPTIVAGISFGAVVGALYASGKSPWELARAATGQRRRDVIPHIADFGLHAAALFKGDRLESYFERLLEGRSFADLVKPLVVVATDIDSGERVLLSEGNLARALRASSSMPGVFAPVEIEGRRLVDGGICTPLPLAALGGETLDLAIGIGAGTTGETSQVIRLTQRMLATEWGRRVHQGLQSSSRTHPLSRLGRGLAYTATSCLPQTICAESLQVHTNPPISWLGFHRAEHAIRAGEAALEAFVPSIRQAAQLRTLGVVTPDGSEAVQDAA